MEKKIKHKHGRPNRKSRVLSRELICESAWKLALHKGATGFTLKDLADSLQIRPPSLYNHIQDMGEVQSEISARALRTLSESLKENLLASLNLNSKDRFFGFCDTYRTFALKHPKVYETTLRSPKGNPSHEKAAQEILQIYQSLLHFKKLNPEAIHKIRILRSTLHEFVSLESQSGFGLKESVAVSFQNLVQMLYRHLFE